MRLKILLFGLIILFSSLIGCQQTEKIITKIDTVKSMTVKYDTIVLNKKDTVVMVNNDTIYISNNATTQSDGEITGTVTIGSVTHTIDYSINSGTGYQDEYDFYDTLGDGSIKYFNVWRSATGSKDNYFWIEDFLPEGGGQIDFSFSFIDDSSGKFYIGGVTVSGLDSNTFSNFNFNRSTNDLTFDFKIKSVDGMANDSVKFVGSYKGKVYQNLNNN